MHEDKLIKRIEQGDITAADELIEVYYPEILKYCIWHAPNRTLAEDATQETFLKLIRYMNKYVHKGNFRAFLYKIAANTCIDIWRKQETIKEFPEGMKLEQIQMEISYEESGFAEVQELLDLQRMICILPNEQREIIILRFVHNLTIREIADVTGISFRTVQSRIRLALKKLKTEYGKEKNDENCSDIRQYEW